ncbi:hypothetical protein [Xenococcus sp. PCC 7305]|uniref:hypothetical protein n=1 Tax=Xenococcus sp. PCC 7305 TaxID=102125 RepID=UPI000302226D|nr:hypothetical protein [Xenococcus sp. PCC 7305]
MRRINTVGESFVAQGHSELKTEGLTRGWKPFLAWNDKSPTVGQYKLSFTNKQPGAKNEQWLIMREISPRNLKILTKLATP